MLAGASSISCLNGRNVDGHRLEDEVGSIRTYSFFTSPLLCSLALGDDAIPGLAEALQTVEGKEAFQPDVPGLVEALKAAVEAILHRGAPASPLSRHELAHKLEADAEGLRGTESRPTHQKAVLDCFRRHVAGMESVVT
jgi:hypothetical protein